MRGRFLCAPRDFSLSKISRVHTILREGLSFYTPFCALVNLGRGWIGPKHYLAVMQARTNPGLLFQRSWRGQTLPPFANHPIGMWAPLWTLAPLGTLARGARDMRWGPGPFPWRLRPAQARPGPWRRAEGAVGGGEQAADPGKKRIWLLRPRAAAPRGALGASDRDGELQPRAAAAARGCEALARPTSSGTRPAGCGSRGSGGRPGGPRRPPGAAGPGD